MKPTALFCISSLGLGHAGRMIALIRSYAGTHDIHVMSAGNALGFLKKEFAESNMSFHECKDYPPLERGRNRGLLFYWYLVVDSISTVFLIQKEHSFVERLSKEIRPEFIVSDGRYGSHVRGIPSFIVSHQISFVMPRGFGIFQKIADYFNYKTFAKFNAVIIPDYEDEALNLAGKLSHHPMLKKLDHAYVGIFSSHARKNVAKDIDFLFMVSGYLLEHKDSFIAKLLEQAKKLPGKKVFVLGNTKENKHEILSEYDVEIYSSASGKLREDLFSRAKCLISRSGYTTVMDLVELGIPGFLVPTPGQTEQEYLAEYLKDRFLTAPSEDFDLASIDFKKAFSVDALASYRTEDSLEKAHELIERYVRPTFFSVVIPIHNEEKYLDKTLVALRDLDYPRERTEVILVENGSSDKTYDIARSYETWGFKVFVSEKGASRAKNLGLSKVSEESEWIVILDADTLVEKGFLADLDQYLKSRRKDRLSVGTTTVLPDGRKRLKADLWFAFYNAGHMLTKTSFAIQIMNARYRSTVRFDEHKTFAEDLKFIKDLRKLGPFFYFKTRTVITSTRRFDEVGWFRLFLKWNWQALVLSHRKKEIKSYDVIR